MPASEVSREIAPFLDDIRDHEHGKVLRAIIDSAYPCGKGTLGIKNT